MFCFDFQVLPYFKIKEIYILTLNSSFRTSDYHGPGVICIPKRILSEALKIEICLAIQKTFKE